MKLELDLRAVDTICVFPSHRTTGSISDRALSLSALKGIAPANYRLALPAALLVLLVLGQGSLAAQNWPPPNPYVQPVPYPQQGYAQPGYAQPGYGQPGYAQQSPTYAPRAYSQPDPYNQQTYPQQPSPQPYIQQPAQQPYDQQQPYGQQAYAPPAGNYPPDDYSQQPQVPVQPLGAEQLEQMVAPIALYPDTLVAQVLAAATYPAQVVAADHWRQAMGYAGPDQIVAGADVQSWDPSVKALTAFPEVLALMDHNLQWTTDLGNAYFNQPQDVLQTVQILRQRAQAAGNLQSTPQEAVTYDQGYIELAPANSQVVYVPAYNPWDAYGEPVAPYHGFSLLGALGSIASFAGSGLLHYGPGIAMGAFSHTPWGMLAWGLDWLSNSVLFNHSSYSSHSSTVAHWNLPRGGAFAARGYASRPGEQYNRIARGDAWAGRGYSSPQPQQFARQPDRYQENRQLEAPRQGFAAPDRNFDRNAVRPALGGYRPVEPPANRPQAYASRPQEAYNRAPEPIHQNFGSAYQGRPGEGYGFRSGGGYASPTPAFRAPAGPQRNDFGGRYAEQSMGRGFSAPKAEKSGGFHPFGGGRNSEFAYGGGKMPKNFGGEKMPKNFGHEKMPKAPHFSEHGHSGGGHSGGGHFFGGHHH
jgi:hypothetical protein